MALHMVIGGSGTGKSSYVYSVVKEAAGLDLRQKCFVVVPDQFTLQTQIDMVRESGCGGIMNIDVLSFSRLAHRVFEETNTGNQAFLDDTGKSLILRKIAGNISDKTPYLKGNLEKYGFIHEVKSALSEFMQYGIDENKLEEIIGFSAKKGLLKNKLTDLLMLYRAFKDYLGDNYITKEETMDILARSLNKSELMRNSVCVFDGFTGFTPVQMRVLGVLLGQCREVYITLTLVGDPFKVGEHDVFGFTAASYKKITELAHKLGVEQADTIVLDKNLRYEDRPDLKALDAGLFNYANNASGIVPENIHIFSAADRESEVRQLGADIRRLVSEGRARYRDIAVITGSFADYEYKLARCFANYEIPAFWDKTSAIVLNPFVESNRAALDILIKNYSPDSVVRFLKTGMSDLENYKADIFDNYIHARGIRGEKAYKSMFVDKDEQVTEIVNEVREYLNICLAPFTDAGIGAGGTKAASVYVRALYDFYKCGHYYDKLQAFSLKFREAGDFSLSAEYEQIYDKSLKLLEQIYDLLGDELLDIKEFEQILEAGFGELRIGTIPQSVDRVLVGDLQRTRLKSIKYLFFIGVDDASIPAKGSKAGIISDADREFLSRMEGLSLAPTPREKMYIERFYLYTVLTKATEGLYLSYSALDGEGKSLRPAYIIGRIRKIFPDLITEIDSETDGIERVNTPGELKALIGRNIRLISEGGESAHIERLKEELFTAVSVLIKLDEAGARALLECCLENSFYTYEDEKLDAQVAALLYGSTMLASVSRMEQFSQCAYSYFLKYGMSLAPRDDHSFDSTNMGTVFHGVLEEMGQIFKEMGTAWYDMDGETVKKLVDEAMERAARRDDCRLFENDSNRYIYRRMTHTMYKAMDMLTYHMKQGRYDISDLEVGIERVEELDAVNVALNKKEKMKLTGKIDRMDTYETEDKVYVKVIDYKTSGKSFSLLNFYRGLQLQLVVYMDEALKIAGKRSGKEASPAALLYYKLNEDAVDGKKATDEESLNKLIRDSLKARGLISSDMERIESMTDLSEGRSDILPISLNKDGSLRSASSLVTDEQMTLLSEYAGYKLRSIGKDIIEGRVSKDPKVIDSGVSSCTYCDFKDVCAFDERISGYEKEEKPEISEDEIYEQIAACLKGGTSDGED